MGFRYSSVKFRFVYLLHKFELVEFTLKLINIVLQLLHKHPNMIPVTDSVMHLDCQRQQLFTVPLEELAHCENRRGLTKSIVSPQNLRRRNQRKAKSVEKFIEK